MSEHAACTQRTRRIECSGWRASVRWGSQLQRPTQAKFGGTMSRTVRKAILSAGCVVMFAATSIAATKFDHAEYLAPKTEGKKDDHPVKGSLAFDKDKKS